MRSFCSAAVLLGLFHDNMSVFGVVSVQEDSNESPLSRRMKLASSSSSSSSTTTSASASTSASTPRSKYIRGVNLGGWLVLERFITPYMFALTDCHLQGDFCWFPGQISAPPTDDPEHRYCDMYQCQFVLDNDGDFAAFDEHSLAMQFAKSDDLKHYKPVLGEYLSYHYENFIRKYDINKLHQAGVTHVRVPMPHWILGDILETEPYVDGQWLYFVRLVGWCREYGIEVWIDIHTAPGSQNGFDNSGLTLDDAPTCRHWSSSPENVERSLNTVIHISHAIVRDSLNDVVTGFGVLNEPFSDCDVPVLKKFYNDAFAEVRRILGDDTAVYISDMFNATQWNDQWWTDPDIYSNTYLDSHYYHVFDGNDRKLSPKQHIALACGKDTRATQACCYEDAPKNKIPSKGISRIIGEWSAAYDVEPEYRLDQILTAMKTKSGDTSMDLPSNNRTASNDRQAFLRQFVKAQIVAFESAPSSDEAETRLGWFYWTIKMEFGAFGEWDFLRGFKEGWIPTLPSSSTSVESVFGTCREIAEQTKDDESIVQEFPDPKTTPDLWHGPVVDDDFVISHAGTVSRDYKGSATSGSHAATTKAEDKTSTTTKNDSSSTAANTQSSASTKNNSDEDEPKSKDTNRSGALAWFPMFCLIFFAWGIWRVFLRNSNFVRNRRQYTSLDTPTQLSV